MSSRPDLTAGVRVRVPLVFAIPLASLAIAGAVAFAFSRVLLSLPKEGATIVALAFAMNILIACAVIALRQRTDAATLGEILVVATYPVLIGVVLAIVGFGSGTAAGEGHHGGGGATGDASTITASSVQFDKDELTFPADEATDLTLVNEDSVEHNVAIYETEDAEKDLFVGQIIGAGETTYEIPAMPKGEYFFRCDVHPTSMTGTVTVE